MKTVLLVEDDPVDVMLVRRIFKKLNLDVDLRVAEDGQEAIDYLSGAGKFEQPQDHVAPTVVLLDLKLPRKSGIEVLRWVRSSSSFARLPVVILSSSKLERDISEAYDAGANSYLVKTGDQESLGEMARTFEQYWLRFNRSVEYESRA